CHQDYYFDTNNSTGSGKCTKRLLYGEKCQNTDQCFSGHSVCNSEGTTDHCICEHNYTFDATTNECRHNGSYSCGTEEEWNQLSGKCQPKNSYSHYYYNHGGHSPGWPWGHSNHRSSTCGDDPDCRQWLFLMFTATFIVFGICFCRFVLKKPNKPATAECGNTRTGRQVPGIVVRGANTDFSCAVVNPIGNHRESTTGSGGNSGGNSPHHSRANSRTNSRVSTVYGPPPAYNSIHENVPLPDSPPPPPYWPPAPAFILPYTSSSQQHIQSASGGSVGADRQIRRHSAVDDMFYNRNPSRSPARQFTPLATNNTFNTLGYSLRLKGQQPRPRSTDNSPVRHPLYVDLIQAPTAPPVDS
ncbi:unnamed protein product, partial [Medioppia subpectinata]